MPWRPALAVRPTPCSTPALPSCPPSFTGLKDPIRGQSPHMGPQRNSWDSASQHRHLPGSKQDPKTQADISLTKLSRASWPYLLQNPMPGKSGGPARSPGLRDGELADMCLSPSSFHFPPPACTVYHISAEQAASTQLLRRGWENLVPGWRVPTVPIVHTLLGPDPTASGGQEPAIRDPLLVRKERGF